MAVASAPSLASIFGEREQGSDVRTANVTAVQAVTNVVRSTLGPHGLDKMMVDDIGEVTISNDGATILKMLEVQHPAAKVLVDLSDLQDREVGDGTTSVVLIASELLRLANSLVKIGVHPTTIIGGYKLAMRESVRYINSSMARDLTSLGGASFLINIARTTFSSKFAGADSDFFSQMVVDAILRVKMTDSQGVVKYPVRAINLLKTHGQGTRDSQLIDGYALDRVGRAGQGMPLAVKNAKVALLDFNLKQHRLQLGVQVQVDSPEELEKVRQKEKDVTKAKIAKILASGANVVITTQGIDDLSIKYFVEAQAIAVRRVNKKDLRRLAKATGATICTSMSTLDDDEEIFDSAWLGNCGEVCEEKIGDWDYMFFKNCQNQRAQSIIFRGANDLLLDELERSAHDALCAVSRTLENDLVCAGGGAVEGALAMYLEDFARTLGTREQLPVAKFAEALLIIPRTLAVNAAQDAPELVARLRNKHHHEQHMKNSSTENNSSTNFGWGLDLTAGELRNNFDAGVVEPSLTKVKALRFATEAAVTILRIDDVIKLFPEPEPDREGY